MVFGKYELWRHPLSSFIKPRDIPTSPLAPDNLQTTLKSDIPKKSIRLAQLLLTAQELNYVLLFHKL